MSRPVHQLVPAERKQFRLIPTYRPFSGRLCCWKERTPLLMRL